MTNIEEIKSKYLQGIATEAELEALLDWVKKSPDHKEELFSEKNIWDAYSYVRNSKTYNVKSELKRFEKRVKSQRKSFYIPDYLKIAATFLIAFSISWLIYSQYSKTEKYPETAEFKTVLVPRGQVSQVFLADGSRIWVNSETKLKIPSVFTRSERVVYLSGEAFFEVAKDSLRPFKVLVDGETIEVLGTSFNVRAYKNSNHVQTTLRTGKIKLLTSRGFTTLAPGEQTILDKSTGQLVLRMVNPSNYDSWKDGRYEFINENLVEVFHMVERWYDVKLVYKENDFENMQYSGVIKRDKSINHFLNLLGHSIPIKYEINCDEVKIEIKRTKK